MIGEAEGEIALAVSRRPLRPAMLGNRQHGAAVGSRNGQGGDFGRLLWDRLVADTEGYLRANPDVPYDKRIEVARFLEDLSASYQGGWYSVISLHGGGSPAAMKQEIWRNYPPGSKVELVERLLERGVLHDESRPVTRNRQPGRCCDAGCSRPGQAIMAPLPNIGGARGDPDRR